MSEQFKNIFNAIKRTSLSESERAGMRNIIRAYMSEHPAHAPFSVRLQDTLSSYARFFDPSQSFMRLAPATLALVLVVGVGTSYAAERALPGDVLYPIKLNINEALRGSFAVSHSAQAEWNTALMTRRLEEAEILVTEDRLTSLTRSEIQKRIITSADKFDAHVQALSVAHDGDTAAAEAQSHLEATLGGHEQVLAALSAEASTSESALQPLLQTVRAQASEAGIARKFIESRIAAGKSNGRLKAAALSKESAADDALARVRAKVTEARHSDASNTLQAARVSATDAENEIIEGSRKIKEGEYGQAFSTLQSALRTMQSAKVRLDATARLNTDIVVAASSTADAGLAATTTDE